MIRENTEYLIGKGRPDGVYVFEIKHYFLEMVHSGQNPLRLGTGYQVFTFMLIQPYRDMSTVKAEVTLPRGKFIEYLLHSLRCKITNLHQY